MFKNLLRRKVDRRGHDYYAELARITKDPARLAQVKEAVEKQGFWQDSHEWRISTVLDARIEPVEVKSHQWFRVTVKCDHEFLCHTQTIERAVFFLALYQQLIIDMFYNLGWASASPEVIGEHDYISW
jgi:hypothetical protein